MIEIDSKALEVAAKTKADLLIPHGFDLYTLMSDSEGNKRPLWELELKDTETIIRAYLEAVSGY